MQKESQLLGRLSKEQAIQGEMQWRNDVLGLSFLQRDKFQFPTCITENGFWWVFESSGMQQKGERMYILKATQLSVIGISDLYYVHVHSCLMNEIVHISFIFISTFRNNYHGVAQPLYPWYHQRDASHFDLSVQWSNII